jgi:hypothetical protein
LILHLQILGYLPLQMSFFGFDKFVICHVGRLEPPSVLTPIMSALKGKVLQYQGQEYKLITACIGHKRLSEVHLYNFHSFWRLFKILGGSFFHY